MKPTLETAEFLRNYLKWLDKWAPDGQPFRRSAGLCSNSGFLWGLDTLLKAHFPENHFTPFSSSLKGYLGATWREAHHRNPLRRAFCHAMLALHDGTPPPWGTTTLWECSTGSDGEDDLIWSEGVPARIKGVNVQVKFKGQWRRVYALPGLVFGFRSGGKIIELANIEWGAS